ANFETVYFERRRRLSRAAICALLEPDDSRWMASVRYKTHEILDEFSWALPAHVNTFSGKDPMHIDPFAGETANLMAHIVDLFEPLLSDDLVANIKWRLRSQFYENYLNRHDDFFWMLSSGNWNALCHQGVVGPALTLEADPRLVARILGYMKRYLAIFLTGYGADGGCSEGPAYWQQGFGWFCALNQQLETRTRGRLSLIENDPKINQMAHYGSRVSLPNFHFVNFSDSLRSGSLNPALLTYLADRLGDDSLRPHALLHYRYLREHGLNFAAQRSDLFYLSRIFLNCPAAIPETIDVQYEDVYFKDLGVLIAHGRDADENFWDFAAKTGHNNEQHNHNDCGSYILNINGLPMIIEIGAPEYTKDYFRERRYEYLAARTLGHSLPIVNGCEQAPGLHYAAKVLAADVDPETVHFCADLTRCYPTAAECNEVVRDFHWDKARGILTVKDYYELNREESFDSSIITDRDVNLAPHQAVIAGEGFSLIVKPLSNTVFAGAEDHEYRDHNGVPRKIRRIIMRPQKIDEGHSISYEISIGA
ncbi:MAG TPA: heparinase II/III family protein, partial [Chthoniobacteraceae bacterium]|nr:heparinase II/III family protein [Chthoniobacteraceae bacterium]